MIHLVPTINEGPAPIPDQGGSECLGRYQHHWAWAWDGLVWTDWLRCTTCNETIRSSRKEGSVTV